MRLENDHSYEVPAIVVHLASDELTTNTRNVDVEC